MSDIRYGKMGLIDFPIPNVAAAKEYIDAGIPHWVYYCCGPRGAYLNRFFDTPLVKIRMSGWLYLPSPRPAVFSIGDTISGTSWTWA